MKILKKFSIGVFETSAKVITQVWSFFPDEHRCQTDGVQILGHGISESLPLQRVSMVQDDGAVARLLPADCLAIEEIGAAGVESTFS